MRLHLGCGGIKLPGFLNIDIEKTAATDLVQDCSDLSRFAADSASLVFSHAFFEHIFRRQRIPFLFGVRRILSSGGCIFFAGLPDFEMVARCYLNRNPGQVTPVFDLWEAYRCTHGLPEYHHDGTTEWMNQLHKSLFDRNEIDMLLNSTGFTRPCIFRHRYRQEPNLLSIGFAATKNNTPIDIMPLFKEIAPVVGDNSPQILCR